MKSYLIFIAVLFAFQCETNDQKPQFQHGELRIIADTNSAGKIHGLAEVYNKYNQLVRRIHYENGISNGPAVSYYTNGIIKDSVGKLISREMYFFNKRLGPEE